MIAVVLAGGYAKRLWPLTTDTPKALLPVAGKPVIHYILQKILKIVPPVSKIIISTNMRFQPQFEEWLKKAEYSNVVLVPDKSRKETEKVGAIKALSNVISSEPAEEFLVLAGDGLFSDELTGFIQFFREKHASVMAVYEAKNVAETKRGATVSLDAKGKILDCVEKSENPKTSLIGACVYAFPANINKRLSEYISLGLPQDQPGRFFQWLYKVEPVYGFMLQGSFLDIGTPESYKEAETFLGGK